ncbi:hypothetical protein PDIDSM_2551 [Penicillium digitatum]|nr:hypothetical protein PDIDSM_2551 [Penicillium digitatum]
MRSFAGIQANAVHGSHIVSKEGLLANDNNDVTRWMIDSGTSTHMTPSRSVFVNFRRRLGTDLYRVSRGEHYFVTFTDDATRFTWLFLLKSRSQVTEVYIQLETYLKTQFNYVIKKVHGDDAPEHKPLAAYLDSKGTVWDPTPPYTKQLNGVAEIKNRHLVEPLVAVMAEYQLPKYLWGLRLGGINYTMNRL